MESKGPGPALGQVFKMRPERVSIRIPGNRIEHANVLRGKSHGRFRKLKQDNEAEELEFAQRVVTPLLQCYPPLLLTVHTVGAAEELTLQGCRCTRGLWQHQE